MEQTTFDKAVTFLSNHFELFFYVSCSLAVLSLIIYIAVRLRFTQIRRMILITFRGLLLSIIGVGQIVLFVVLGVLYWQNYQKPAPELLLSSQMSASTHWVKDRLRIYYIDGNTLQSIQINGKGHQEILTVNDPIIEYHFSPNGQQILVLTQNDLYLVDQTTNTSQRVDGLQKMSAAGNPAQAQRISGSISGLQWSPDSKKFVYEIARWSQFASQDNVYIYTLKDQLKRSVKSPTRRISSLYWDQQGENLYYLQHESQDTSESFVAYQVKVFRIPLTTLTPEFMTQIPYEEASVPIENLNLRGIDLFLPGSKLSFGRSLPKEHRFSQNGSEIGIDEDDYLYFVRFKWFRKRLYNIPRELRSSDMPRYQYKGGDLAIGHIRWIPGGRYVVMEHKHWGVLILEPTTEKIGLLIKANGHSFGWYQNQRS